MTTSRSNMRSARMIPGLSRQRFTRPEQAVGPFEPIITGAGFPQESPDSLTKKAPFLHNIAEEPLLDATKVVGWNDELPEGNPRLCKTDSLDDVFIRLPHIHEQVNPQRIVVNPASGYGGAAGDRLHFRYGDPDIHHPSNSDDEDLGLEDEEEQKRDAEFTRGCITLFSKLIARRLSRAMIDLVGIEPNPGPGKSGKKKINQVKKAVVVKRKTAVVQRIVRGPSWSTDMLAYRRCLLDPWDAEPVRLGGDMMQPSSVITLKSSVDLACSTTGSLSVVAYPRARNSVLYSTTVATPYAYSVKEFPNGGTLAGVALGARVISSGIRVTCTSSDTSNNGVLTLGCLPRECVLNSSSAGGTTRSGMPFDSTVASPTAPPILGAAEFRNFAATESMPLKGGGSAVFRPQDPLDFTFRDTLVQLPTSFVQEEELVPFFVVGVVGATASSVITLEFVAHLEYTASEAYTGIASVGMGSMSQTDIIAVCKDTVSGIANTASRGYDFLQDLRSSVPGQWAEGRIREHLNARRQNRLIAGSSS